VAISSEAAAKVGAELAPLRHELACSTTAHRLLQEQASSSIASNAAAQDQVEKLLAQKAAIHEEGGLFRTSTRPTLNSRTRTCTRFLLRAPV